MTSARFRPAVADRPLVGPRKFQSVVVLHHTLGWKLIDDQIDLTSISRISLVTRFVVYSDRGQRLSKHARADVYTHPPSPSLDFSSVFDISSNKSNVQIFSFFTFFYADSFFLLLFEWRLLNEERERWNFIGSAKTLSLDGKRSGKFNHRPTKIAISSKCRVYMYMYVRAQIRTMSVAPGWFSAKEKQP